MRKLLPVLVLLHCPVGAQTASYTYINQKAPYKNQVPPSLTALNLPKVGTTFKLRVPGSYGGGSARTAINSLAFGVSNPNLPFRAIGGWLFTSAEIIIPTPWAITNPGMVTMSFVIPNSPQWLGVRFYQQVRVSGHTGGARPIPFGYLSRGGLALIGN